MPVCPLEAVQVRMGRRIHRGIAGTAAQDRAGAANAGPMVTRTKTSADRELTTSRERPDCYFPGADGACFALSWPMEMTCAGVA